MRDMVMPKYTENLNSSKEMEYTQEAVPRSPYKHLHLPGISRNEFPSISQSHSFRPQNSTSEFLKTELSLDIFTFDKIKMDRIGSGRNSALFKSNEETFYQTFS
jgi:hypothetical protein